MNTTIKNLQWLARLTYSLVAAVLLTVGIAHAQRDNGYLGPPYLNPNFRSSTPPGPRTGPGPGILPNVIINDRSLQRGSDNQSELAVAACGGVVVAGFNDSVGFVDRTIRNGMTGWGYSTDGGFTWTDGGSLPLFAAVDFGTRGDPSLFVDWACNFYFANLYNPGQFIMYFPLVISVHTGRFDPNLGKVVWNRPTLIGTDVDKEHIAVDPRTIVPRPSVYVAYTNFAISPRQIEVTRSTDGGQTWSAPVVLASGNVQGPIPRVGPSGEVHVAWENFPDAPRAIKIRTAATWPNFGAETLVSNVVPIALPRFMDRVNEFPTMAVDTTAGGLNRGRVYVAWNDGGFGGADTIGSILLKHSLDGTTWSTPLIMVNDDGNPSDTLTHHWFPWLSVNPNGVVYLGWYDRRLRGTTDHLTDVFAASFTVAAGVSPNKRLTDQSFSMAVPYRMGPNFGDYNGGYATSTTFHYGWGDGRLGDPDAFSGGWSVQ